MPYLGDYLGQILSELSMARMQADLEALRIAELYATHPLLRTMPIPHMRLPEVDLDVPVLVQESADGSADRLTRGGAPPAELRRAFDDVLAVHLAKAGTALSVANRKRLAGAIDSRFAAVQMPPETSVDVLRVADELAATAVETLSDIQSTRRRQDPAIAIPDLGELRPEVRLAFLKLRTPPPRLTVLVTTAEIREAGTQESIMRLRLRVAEEGLEWTTIESQGTETARLVPE